MRLLTCRMEPDGAPRLALRVGGRVMDVGRAARARRGLEMVPEWYEAPVFYVSNPGALLGHGEPLAAPRYTVELDAGGMT